MSFTNKSQNPWDVSSLDEFLYYNCPECEVKSSTKEQFVGHAIVAHEQARDTIPAIVNKKSQHLKENQVEKEVPKVKVEPTSDTENTESPVVIKISKDPKTTPQQVKKPTPQAQVKETTPQEVKKTTPQQVKRQRTNNSASPFQSWKKKKANDDEEEFITERDPKTNRIRYKCEQCGKDFAGKQYLIGHVRSVHEGILFKCDLCPFESTSRSYVHRHVQMDHKGISYKCTRCKSILTSKQGWEKHMATHHPDQMLNSEFDVKALDQDGKTPINDSAFFIDES